MTTQLTETSAGGIVFRKKNGKLECLVICHEGVGHWGFPKGKIGDEVNNESASEAALREVKEEGGVTARLATDKPITTHYYYKREGNLIAKTVHYFPMWYESGDPNDHDEEVSEARFVPVEKVPSIVTYPLDKKAFEKALSIVTSLGAGEGN